MDTAQEEIQMRKNYDLHHTVLKLSWLYLASQVAIAALLGFMPKHSSHAPQGATHHIERVVSSK